MMGIGIQISLYQYGDYCFKNWDIFFLPSSNIVLRVCPLPSFLSIISHLTNQSIIFLIIDRPVHPPLDGDFTEGSQCPKGAFQWKQLSVSQQFVCVGSVTPWRTDPLLLAPAPPQQGLGEDVEVRLCLKGRYAMNQLTTKARALSLNLSLDAADI